MSIHYFVEILSYNGEVQRREKFTALPVRIGRAYTNDVVLDDPHSAAEHALIDINENGIITICDLDTRNSISLKGKKQKEFDVHGDDIFSLGQTHIRFRTSHYVVPAELGDDSRYRWDGWPMLIGSIFIISLLSLSNTWLGNVDNSKSTAYIMDASMWLGFAAVWSGIWALANRVFNGSAHFARHLFILSCGFAALEIMDYLFSILAYAFSWEIFTRYSSHVEIAILITTIYQHLRQVNPHKHKRKRLQIICVGLALIGSSLMLLKNHQSTNLYADELYMHELLPPALRVSRNHSLEELNRNFAELKTEIDGDREKTLKEKANDKK